MAVGCLQDKGRSSLPGTEERNEKVVPFPYVGELTNKEFALEALDLMTGLDKWTGDKEPKEVFEEHFGKNVRV